MPVYLTFFVVLLWYTRSRMNLAWKNALITSGIGSFVLAMVILFALTNFRLFIIIVIGLVGAFWYWGADARRSAYRKWKNSEPEIFTPLKFANIVSEVLPDEELKYTEEIPFNRSFIFAANSENKMPDVAGNFPIYFNAAPADNEMAFQEYGMLISTAQIVINNQVDDPNEKKKYKLKTISFPFQDAYYLTVDDFYITVFYADGSTIKHIMSERDTHIISAVMKAAIDAGWTKVCEQAITDGETDTTAQDGVDDIFTNVKENGRAEALNLLNEAQSEEELSEDGDNEINSDSEQSRVTDLDEAISQGEDQIAQMRQHDAMQADANGSVDGSINSAISQNQINDRFGGGQGHGHVGEQAGDTLDGLKLKKVQMTGNDHAKNGADRIVGKKNIQTKFYKTAQGSIDAVFDTNSHSPKYTNPDGTMMTVEVPRDQYPEAVKKMAKRIERGDLIKSDNETDPMNAAKYVKKGAISYEHSRIATKSIFDRHSTITQKVNGQVVTREVTFREKLVWSAGLDFLSGAKASLPTAVISSVWVMTVSIQRGAKPEEALKLAAEAIVKPVLIGGVIYGVSSQLAGSKLGKSLAKTALGRGRDGANKVAPRAAMALTVVITFGPDVIDALRGRISMRQLVKNTAVTGTGMLVGAWIGTAIGPGWLSAAGAFAGGTIASLLAKKIADAMSEDDAVAMIRIAKEEFIETVIAAPLTQEEFQNIINATFADKHFSSLLKVMFAQKEGSRRFIHETYFNLVVEQFSARPLPSEDDVLTAVSLGMEGQKIQTSRATQNSVVSAS